MKKITRYIDKLTSNNPNSPTQTRARHQVSPPNPSTALPSTSFPTHHGPSTPIHSRSKGSSMNHARRWIRKNITKRHRCLVDMLPDDVLLSIFEFCANAVVGYRSQQEWQTLVRVCPRWRSLVFGSPRGLNLRLICTDRTPARDMLPLMLDVWPPLPLVIESIRYHWQVENVDNIIAVLEHRNRACRIRFLGIPCLYLEKVLASMQEPFPELTELILWPRLETMAVLPDSFLGGSAPRLRILDLFNIPFPGLPKLLLSATHLVNLRLWDIPHSGYFSPEAIATALSTLTSLAVLQIEFQSPLSLPDRASRRPPSPKRFVFPVLTYFTFKGASEYLDDLLIRIDAPPLESLGITFFNQILFDTPQMVQFISRTSALKAPEKARVFFMDGAATIRLSLRASDFDYYEILRVEVRCTSSDWQVSSLEQVCTWCFPPLSTLEDLYISEYPYSRPKWRDNVENSLWLELLQPFTTVMNLYVSEKFVSRIMPSLQELVVERTTEVLPSLQNIFLEGLETSGPVWEGVQQFVARRQGSHPIAVFHWDGGTEHDV